MASRGTIYLKLSKEEFFQQPHSLNILSFDATNYVIKET